MEAKKILLVEDDPNFGSVLRDYLSLNDFEVTLAKNGMEGFEKFKKDTYGFMYFGCYDALQRWIYFSKRN